MPEAISVRLRGVRKTYASESGPIEAVHATDVRFPAGVVSALVGPSGCGKSTLLRLVAGLDGADDGSVHVDGLDVTGLRGRPLRDYRRHVAAYVAQRPSANLVWHLRMRDHVRDTRTLVRLGLAERLDARPEQLSGGEQARAAVALALARETPLLLLDEPTAELDRATASHVLDALVECAGRGATIVVATHDPDVIVAAAAVHDLAVAPGAAVPAGAAVYTATPGSGVHPRALTKRYGPTHAVEEVSLDLAPGELGVILGRSGSGKSTLLMLLGGWLTPDSGETGVGGTQWQQIGYLPQRFGLLPELSIAENVALPLRIAAVADDSAELLERLDLAPLAGRIPAETSIGQQQRTALARALVTHPAVLLADEPTSHQDARSAARVWAAIETARSEGTACLVATHDQAAAVHGDRVWELVDGRIYSNGNSSPNRR